MKLKDSCSLEEKLWQTLVSVFENRDITLLTKICVVKAMFFLVVMYGCESWTIRKLMLSNCGAGEDSWVSLGQQGDQTSQSWRKLALNFNWKDWGWSSNSLATWCEEMTHWKRLWCWERLRAGGEGEMEDEMVGWHHWLSGHEFEQTLGDGEGQGSMLCCSLWCHKESDVT